MRRVVKRGAMQADEALAWAAPFIARASRQLAQGERDLADDLAQEARVRVWQLAAERPRMRREVRSAVWYAMLHARRNELRQRGDESDVAAEQAAGAPTPGRRHFTREIIVTG